MRRHLIDVIAIIGTATIALVYLLVSQPQWRGVVLRGYVFVVGAMAMLVVVSALGDAIPRRRRSDFETALAQTKRRKHTVTELERVQREVTMATTSAFDLHMRVLPQLREIAQARLERAGKRPSPETLGRWWDLLRPDREAPEERFGSGIKLTDLRDCVADLEKIR